MLRPTKDLNSDMHASLLSYSGCATMAVSTCSTVVTSRQHNLHFDSAKTPALLEKAGLKVDSTLGSNRDIGFRAGTSYPFRMWDAATRDWLRLVEIPLVLHDGALLRPDNLDLDLESAFALCKTIIDRVVETRGVVTLLWHPDKAALPDWFTLYTRLLAYIHEQNGWGASARLRRSTGRCAPVRCPSPR